jgi:endonuclease/exonuclease/phosphatase family metal-dependent hydrolase
VLVHPRLDVLGAEAARLPVAGLLTRRRGYAAVTVAAEGAALTVASIHLPLRPDERVAHCRAVVERLRAIAPSAYLVAGDLNEPPGGPAWDALGVLVHDAAVLLGPGHAASTYPARSPRSRIDAILVSSDVEVLALHVAGPRERLDAALLARASDHLPLVAQVRRRFSPAAARASRG